MLSQWRPDSFTTQDNNGLLPVLRKVIIWAIHCVLSIGPLGTNLNEILIKTQQFASRKNGFEYIVCKMAAIVSRPQCVNDMLD